MGLDEGAGVGWDGLVSPSGPEGGRRGRWSGRVEERGSSLELI